VRRRKGDLGLLYFSALYTLYSIRLLIDIDVVQTLYAVPSLSWQKLIDVLTYLMPVARAFPLVAGIESHLYR
jgi:hypothetical protein